MRATVLEAPPEAGAIFFSGCIVRCGSRCSFEQVKLCASAPAMTVSQSRPGVPAALRVISDQRKKLLLAVGLCHGALQLR